METIMTEQPPMLEERIDIALQPDAAVTAADLAALIEETETNIAKAEQSWTVDLTSSPDPEAADQARMYATIAANALRTFLLPKLRARYAQVHEQEVAAAWWAEQEAAWLTKYDALKRERDALAEELPEVYPDAARKTANLFGRIAVNNEALAALHRDRPDGMEQHLLLSAELHARGLESFSTPSLLTSVHLFDWDTGHQICPPPRPSMASAFAAIAMPAYNSRRFSGDWWKDNDRRAAAQRAQQQGMADYYARRTEGTRGSRECRTGRYRLVALTPVLRFVRSRQRFVRCCHDGLEAGQLSQASPGQTHT
jgi:hypothetical protein